MRAAALNEHMQADARQRHDWRAFPLQWRLVSSKHSRSWRSELVLDLERCPSERGPFCPRFASVVRQELDQEKGIHYLKTLPRLVRGSGILNR